MRKILFVIILALMAVSCLDQAAYKQSYTLVASFEYNNLSYDKLFGADSLYHDVEYKSGIGWNYMAFFEKVDDAGEFQGGFMMSYLSHPKNGSADGLSDNIYRAFDKEGKTRGNTYLVLHITDQMPEYDMGFMFEPMEGQMGTCMMQSCTVNNTVAVAKEAAEKLVVGQKLTFSAKGYLDGKVTGAVENVVLAEKIEGKDSVMCRWVTVDLTRLGVVDRVDFDVTVPEGVDIPKAVCIDDVVANISLVL